jgi:type IV secretion system protein VirB5
MATTEEHLQARHQWRDQRDYYRRLILIMTGIAGGSLVVAAISASWVGYIGSQSKFVPILYNVATGNPMLIGKGDVAMPADIRLVRSTIAHWVADMRRVTSDREEQKIIGKRAYKLISGGGPAHAKADAWFDKSNPFERNKKELVTATIGYVQQETAKTWRVQWTEEMRDLNGGLKGVEEWQATVTISMREPSENDAFDNPVGVHIDDFEWDRSHIKIQ